MDWDQPQRWQIGPADISEVEVTDMLRFSLDKPLLLWLWPSSQSSLVLSAWKSYASVFPMQKVSETEPQTSPHFSTLGGKPIFTPSECILVNIQSWSIPALSLSFCFWLRHQMNSFTLYEQQIYCISLKSHWFFLLHFLSVHHVPKNTLCLPSHTWESPPAVVLSHPEWSSHWSRWEFGVGFQHRMHSRRDKRAPDKSLHVW